MEKWVIDEMEKGMKWEDEFIEKYDDSAIWELLRSLGKGKGEHMRKLLEENISDSRKHAAAIKGILERLGSKNGK